MSTRFAFLLLALLFFMYPPATQAQTQAQSLVLTLEDNATIQLLVKPDGTQLNGSSPPEPISGGMAARLIYADASSSQWLVTDFRFQSEHWTIEKNTNTCGSIDVNIWAQAGAWTNAVFTNNGAAYPCTDVNHQAVIQNTSLSGTYEGVVELTAFPFTGTVGDPGEAALNSSERGVFFGLGLAVISGTLRVEASDGTATVVKLRQGIPAGPSPNQTLQDWNPPWEDIQYDSDTTLPKNGELENRIYNYGCKLTSLSMLLNSVGVQTLPLAGTSTFVPNDPGNLNAWMVANNLYDNEGVHAVPVVASLVKPPNNTKLTFNVVEHDSQKDLSGAQQFLDDTLNVANLPNVVGSPVLVGVDDKCAQENPPQTFPCHYVAVWGERNGDYLIADPKPTNSAVCLPNCVSNGVIGNLVIGNLQTYTHLKLSDYDHYVTLGYVSDPTNLSGLAISTPSNVNLALTSPSGAVTGFDASTQTVIDAIPGSGYFVESIQNNEDASLSTPPVTVVEASDFSGGQYTLTVTGASSSTYAVNIVVVSEDGSIQPTLTVNGITRLGSVSNFNVGFDTNPGATSTVVRSATPASALNDLNNSLSLGLIKNRLIAVSLSILLQGAEKAQAKGNCWGASDILRLFIGEVKAVEGKAIAPLAAQVLLEDAEYLINNCGKT
jgi:hypothetical protein